MNLFDTAFHLVSTALALYFAQVRFRARMPLFGHAMTVCAIAGLVLSFKGLDLAANVCAASYVLLYMKSLTIIQTNGLSDGSRF
ncbi:MAG: hypothetical protein ACJ8OJ_08585 [Povalibacter sp.]|jgi:hypothetical protein